METSLREETKTRCLLHLLSQTASLITRDYFPLSALIISFSTMAPLMMELGKKPHPSPAHELWVWSPEARKPWIQGSQVSYLAHCGITTWKEKLPTRRAGQEPCREAKPCVGRQMWWEFRCLNSRMRRGASHPSPIWSVTCAHCREGVGKAHFKG